MVPELRLRLRRSGCSRKSRELPGGQGPGRAARTGPYQCRRKPRPILSHHRRSPNPWGLKPWHGRRGNAVSCSQGCAYGELLNGHHRPSLRRLLCRGVCHSSGRSAAPLVLDLPTISLQHRLPQQENSLLPYARCIDSSAILRGLAD